MTDNAKLGFFKCILISVKNLEEYDKLAIQPIRKTIGFFIKLILIFAFVLSIIYTIQVYKLVNVAKEKIDEVPEFEYNEGKIEFKENNPVIIDNISELLDSVLILPKVDEETEKEYMTKIKTYNNYLILGEDNFVISIKGNKLQYDYTKILENYSIKSFNKADASNFIKSIDTVPLCLAFILVAMINMFIFYGISIALDISITFLVAFITSRIARIRLRNSAIVNIGIYSLTLSIILYLLYLIINLFTGFQLSRFRLMYILIASVYSAIAVLIIKADFIERQQELAKVIQVQQEVRRELNEEENKEENKENDSKDGSPEQKENQNDNKNDEKEKADGVVPEPTENVELNPEQSISTQNINKDNKIEE